VTSFAIIPRGGFGNELSDRLELAADVTRARSPADAFKSGADVVIAALHREDRRLLATCDGAAFANSIRNLAGSGADHWSIRSPADRVTAVSWSGDTSVASRTP